MSVSSGHCYALLPFSASLRMQKIPQNELTNFLVYLFISEYGTTKSQEFF
jgi:hypothetical protein